MKTGRLICLVLGLAIVGAHRLSGQQALRPPAVPLVAHDPYFSIWSFTDDLAADWPRHWTGAVHALSSMIRVDGQTFRLMGVPVRTVAPAKQLSLDVFPTRTVYRWQAGPVAVTLTFTTPVLPTDLDQLSRPVTYLTWTVHATDGREHAVQIYYDNSAELVVNTADQPVTWSRPAVTGLDVLRMGSQEQPVLAKDGDNLRIDWGYLYVATKTQDAVRCVVAAHEQARQAFVADGTVPAEDDPRKPRPANDDWPVCTVAFDLGRISQEPVSRWIMLAYDDLYSIQYLGENLRPWWRRDGLEAEALLKVAAQEYPDLVRLCEVFDKSLMTDLEQVGGIQYAQLCALAYRQAIAAHKLAAGPARQPLMFSKECFSNGCIATVDVMYPAAPIFMLLSNDLLKATVLPVLEYAASPRWKFDFAPHDLGRYPKANGQRYGGGEKSEENQMPVEESGNLLILMTAISQIDGNTRFAERHWPLLSRWAAFLKAKGLDPENQLCTDDFAGHLAHNANLSLKAILALGGYARLCEMAGRDREAGEYRQTAEEFARQWQQLADDGDHYRLAFDRPGTWSQKYNLVWDRLLNLNLFPPAVARKEIAFYRTQLREFGLPLDNRELYTKTDWHVWTATLAESDEDFQTLMKPVYAFVSKTPQRVPLTDWYWTHTAEKRGFQARPVIGGVFIKALADPAIWARWSRAGGVAH